MQDRIPTYPGRVTLTPVSGQENTYDLLRADEPSQVGTPLNTATLFKPETEAAFFGAAANRTVNDALYLIGTTFTAAAVQITYNGAQPANQVAVHNAAPLSHQNLYVDGNNVTSADNSATLEEHMANPMAHQNLVIDGNAGQ